MKAISGLKTLSIDWTGRIHAAGTRYTSIGTALRSHGTALTKLASNSRNYRDQDLSPTLIGSLAELTALQSLRLPIEVILWNDDDGSDDGFAEQEMLSLGTSLHSSLRYLTVIDDFDAANDVYVLDTALVDLGTDAAYGDSSGFVCTAVRHSVRISSIWGGVHVTRMSCAYCRDAVCRVLLQEGWYGHGYR